MKTKCIFILIMMCVINYTHAQEKLFEKLSDQETIERVTLTKEQLEEQMGDQMDVFGINLEGVELLEIFVSEEEEGNQIMRKEISDYFAEDKSYELSMEIKEEEEAIFYIKSDGDWITSFVMFVIDGDETALITLQGRFAKDAIQSIITEAIANINDN